MIGYGWVPACALKAGDHLFSASGVALVVIDAEAVAEEADHFNFEVEHFHTYFVSGSLSSTGLLVHNGPCKVKDILGKLGVDGTDMDKAIAGEPVSWQINTSENGNMAGFLKLEGDNLVLQILSSNEPGRLVAGKKFLEIQKSGLSLARELGASTLELQGGSFLNQNLKQGLIEKRGFKEGVQSLDRFGWGDESQDIVSKFFEVD